MIKSQKQDKFKHKRLEYFANRFSEAHLDLACYGAFPLALTPELLYCLRENFAPDAPFIAVADILLFLCETVGYQLYELDTEVRNELLVYLKSRLGDEKLYEKLLCKLSDFMVAYIRQQLKSNDYADEDLGATPHWTALAYIKPEEAVKDIAEELQKALKQQPGNLLKFSSIIEGYADTDPLLKAGFEPLLILSRGLDAKARGDEETAEEEFANLRQEYGSQLEIQGVKFDIPSDGKGGELEDFTFDVVTVNAKGEEVKRELGKAQYFVEKLGDGVTLDMVAIPGGTFTMGAPEGEATSADDERPQHQVTVPAFFMGKYPVTQAQWRVVANFEQVSHSLEPDPSRFKGDDLPVETIDWYDAEEFCSRLSKATGKTYSLPIEAEWEYACRAGTTTPFHFGETITPDLANFNGNYTYASAPKGEYREKTTPVGSFKLANAFGLYDMHGNVNEWCDFLWQDNIETDHQSWPLRGGSWNDYAWICRSDYSELYVRGDGSSDIGFRVVVSAERT
ncbi:formylglycine-generating enzyme family protein [Nodularia sp. UHCC 0506]|uniref:formylglycine-generating enzyme family protein n=1 Tax=Nodularia sp. UHCC 0506 TaxID=3110243 RepID=UPI002B214276|nr:formylglycine-generating enzyme family protein [Nodularia sp. UHCC 0506]MEA5512548.1 formylglycine-generating enzyme family protein [Nodularia sp. UHCC 0506]